MRNGDPGIRSFMVDGAIDRYAGPQSQPVAAPRPDVSEARLVLIVVAAWIALSDLIVKLLLPTESGLYHKRTHTELLLILAITSAAVYFVPLARSSLTSLGAGLMVGGGIGNAVSILVFPLGVPNPFVVADSGWIVAFNLADICVAIGFVLMTAGVWSLAAEQRHELGQPVGSRSGGPGDG